MPRKLKVFRTPIGFDDAYVAAPSRKAALAAWGSDADLFARGVAEQVTDPRLMEESLAAPGEVIRRSRGDLAAQLGALPPKRKARRAKQAADRGEAPEAETRKSTRGETARPKPPPSRDKLDAAEAALTDAVAAHEAEIAALEQEREALQKRIEALRERGRKALVRLERERENARESYRAALERWSSR